MLRPRFHNRRLSYHEEYGADIKNRLLLKPQLHPPALFTGPRRLELKDQREVELIDGAEHFPLPVPQPQAMNVGQLYPIPFVPVSKRQV